MNIPGICIGIEHPQKEKGEEIYGDEPQVIFPKDLNAWKARIEESFKDYGEMSIGASTTSAETIAIVFGHTDDVTSAFTALNNGTHFGFLADEKTLKQLRAVIDVAIAAVRH